MQIEITMRYSYPPIGRAKIQKTDNTNYRLASKQEKLVSLMIGMQNDAATLEDSRNFLQGQIVLPYGQQSCDKVFTQPA